MLVTAFKELDQNNGWPGRNDCQAAYGQDCVDVHVFGAQARKAHRSAAGNCVCNNHKKWRAVGVR